MLEFLDANYSLAALWGTWGAVWLGYLAFFFAERVIPANRNPNVSEYLADIRANLAYVFFSPIALIAGYTITAPIADLLGGPIFQIPLSEFGSESILVFFLAFVPMFVFDFFYYWFHRFQHEWNWLWRIHRLHHSERALNVMTNFRHHWLEQFFRAFLIFLPMNWLIKIDPVQSAVAAILIGQWSNFFHANIRLSMGPLTAIFTGPQYHRIHHSIEAEHVNRNFAAFFPFWDWLFGTYVRPSKSEWPAVGLEDSDGNCTLLEILIAPFREWWMLARRAYGGKLPKDS